MINSKFIITHNILIRRIKCLLLLNLFISSTKSYVSSQIKFILDKPLLELKKEEYEFQMLLGVTEELRDIILRAGHRLRVYVPFGEQWYAYSTRRLKENPNMAGYIIKSILHLD